MLRHMTSRFSNRTLSYSNQWHQYRNTSCEITETGQTLSENVVFMLDRIAPGSLTHRSLYSGFKCLVSHSTSVKVYHSVSSVCCLLNQSDHMTPSLRNLQWLPVDFRTELMYIFLHILMALLHRYQTCSYYINPADLSDHKAPISFMFLQLCT